jgi:hypothetical protein
MPITTNIGELSESGARHRERQRTHGVRSFGLIQRIGARGQM